MKDLETAISEKTKDVTSLREETRNIDNELGSLNSSLTTAQARERVGEMAWSLFIVLNSENSV